MKGKSPMAELNILVPMAGESPFFNLPDYHFPKPLVEINGRAMIEIVIENLSRIPGKKRFTFVVREEDCLKFHLDKVLNLLTNNQCVVIRQQQDTRGAVCSSLLAVEYINNDQELIISNGDQILDVDFSGILSEFRGEKVDGGIICFPSVHPKWSYVRVNENLMITEAAEKRPISKHATAAWLYFKKGNDYVRAAMKSIRNDAHVNGLFYIVPTVNELILENKRIKMFPIDGHKYHSFYSPKKIEEYLESLSSGS